MFCFSLKMKVQGIQLWTMGRPAYSGPTAYHFFFKFLQQELLGSCGSVRWSDVLHSPLLIFFRVLEHALADFSEEGMHNWSLPIHYNHEKHYLLILETIGFNNYVWVHCVPTPIIFTT